MRDGIKKYLIGFTVGIIIVVICILASQRAEAFTNIYAWVTNGAGENVYSGYITGWEVVPILAFSRPSDFYIIVTGEDEYKYMTDMKNVVIKYK